MKKVILKIGGMSCSACQQTVEKYLNKQEGITASVNLVMQQALIEYDDTKITLKDLDRLIKESGYQSLGIYHEKEEKKENNTLYLISFGILVLIIMYISMSHMLNLPMISFLNIKSHPINYGLSLLILTIPFIIYGLDIIKSGITKLIHKNPNMDTLVTIGVLSSFIYSICNLLVIIKNKEIPEHLYFESSAMIIYFIKLGRELSRNSKEKTKDAIKELVTITPQTALLKTKEGEKEVTIDEVKKDDILIGKPGMRIAVDGIIVKGTTHLDESILTGESNYNKKSEFDKVIAGSINIDGYIEYKAVNIGPKSTISEIVRLVVEAANTKAPIGKLADKISNYFVPSIIIIAIITFMLNIALKNSLNTSITSFVTVLVVACPCALGLATPLAIVVSVGRSAKEGILIKTSETLENINKIDTIVFDKTGTLTYGHLSISKINNYSNYSNQEIYTIASSLEHNSNHPIASAFKEYYNNQIKVENFKNLSGIGITGIINKKEYYLGNHKLLKELNIKEKYDEESFIKEGNSIIYVIENKKIIAIIGVKDIIRKNIKNTINQLKQMHKEIIILSGDNEKTANIIANNIGIKKVIANILPKEKEKIIKELIKNNHTVMMIGDGINDAPALVSANIGVSIKGGTDIARDSADIILIQDDISKIITLINISKNTIKIIKQNLFWAFIYNILMIPIAIGLLKPIGITISPMLASISMTLSSLTVVFNSLRLRKI